MLQCKVSAAVVVAASSTAAAAWQWPTLDGPSVRAGDADCWGEGFSVAMCCGQQELAQCFPEGSSFSKERCCSLHVQYGASDGERTSISSKRKLAPVAASAWLGLKLRLIACTYGGSPPPYCGRHTLKMLEADLRRAHRLSESPDADDTEGNNIVGTMQQQSSDVDAPMEVLAALCWKLLALRSILREATESCETNLATLSPDAVSWLMDFLSVWELVQIFELGDLVKLSWPIFGLLHLLREDWLILVSRGCHGIRPSGGDPCLNSSSAPSNEQLLASLSATETDDEFRRLTLVPGDTCGWTQTVTQAFAGIHFLELNNHARYRAYTEDGYVRIPDYGGTQELRSIMVTRTLLQNLASIGNSVDGNKRAASHIEHARLILEGAWNFLDFSARIESHNMLKAEWLLQELLPKAPVFLEIGANDGIDVASFLDTWPESVVHAFEPDRTAMAFMKRNLDGLEGLDGASARRRRIGGYHLYPLAIAGETGVLDFYVRPDLPMQSAQNMLFRPNAKFKEMWPQIEFATKPEKVKAMTLDDWSAQYGVEYADYAEIDVQCAEFPLLNASRHFLPTIKALQAEVCYPPGMCEGAEFFDAVRDLLHGKGFEVLVVQHNAATDLCADVIFVNVAHGPGTSLASMRGPIDADAASS